MRLGENPAKLQHHANPIRAGARFSANPCEQGQENHLLPRVGDKLSIDSIQRVRSLPSASINAVPKIPGTPWAASNMDESLRDHSTQGHGKCHLKKQSELASCCISYCLSINHFDGLLTISTRFRRRIGTKKAIRQMITIPTAGTRFCSAGALLKGPQRLIRSITSKWGQRTPQQGHWADAHDLFGLLGRS